MKVTVPSGPKPWPTALMAMTAKPACASGGSDGGGAAEAAVAEAVAEDNDGIARGGLGGGGDEGVVVDGVGLGYAVSGVVQG